MRMASVGAGVLLTHIGDGSISVRRLDLERGDQSVLGLDRHLVRLVAHLDSDRVPQGHGAASPDRKPPWVSVAAHPTGTEHLSARRPRPLVPIGLRERYRRLIVSRR